jgi:hypothetical protein
MISCSLRQWRTDHLSDRVYNILPCRYNIRPILMIDAAACIAGVFLIDRSIDRKQTDR